MVHATFTLLLQVLAQDAAGLSAVGGVVQGNVAVDILQQNVHPGLPVRPGSRRRRRGHTQRKTQFNPRPFIRLHVMTKWAPLSGLPRGVDLHSGAKALADSAMSELKNSLNDCPEVGLAKSEGIGYRHRASLV